MYDRPGLGDITIPSIMVSVWPLKPAALPLVLRSLAQASSSCRIERRDEKVKVPLALVLKNLQARLPDLSRLHARYPYCDEATIASNNSRSSRIFIGFPETTLSSSPMCT